MANHSVPGIVGVSARFPRIDRGTLCLAETLPPGIREAWGGWLQSQFSVPCSLRVTTDDLNAIMPMLKLNLDERRKAGIKNAVDWMARDLVSPLNAAMDEFGLFDNPGRVCAFLAQMAKESSELVEWRERGGDAYFKKLYTRNGQSEADAVAYSGRGPIQLTWKRNYKRAGERLRMDLLKDYKQVSDDPSTGFRAAAWFWAECSPAINRCCDQLTGLVDELLPGSRVERSIFDKISRLVNGPKCNTYVHRWSYYVRAVKAIWPAENR